MQLNSASSVTGTLRGYDVFMNITVAEAIERSKNGDVALGTAVIRGNLIVSMEALEKIN